MVIGILLSIGHSLVGFLSVVVKTAKSGTEATAATKEREGVEKALTQAKSDHDATIKELESAQEKIASDMGTSMKDISDAITKAGADIKTGEANKNAYIKDFEKGGLLSTGMFEKGKKDLANRMRAQQGKVIGNKDLQANLKKALKDSGVDLADDDKKDKTPKTEEPKTK